MPTIEPKGRGRADIMLVQLGLAHSRARARQMIAEGAVRVDGQLLDKPARMLDASSQIEIDSQLSGWVSRGALKLLAGLDLFPQIDPAGKYCLDLGSSTGGFVQLLLKAGAKQVTAVDVGTGQLHPSLRADPRLLLLEQTDARDLTSHLICQPIELITADLSFISASKALGPALSLAAPACQLLLLVKPQFELGPADIGKGGIVRDPSARAQALAKISGWIGDQGWQLQGSHQSPVTGQDGNIEFLLLAQKPA